MGFILLDLKKSVQLSVTNPDRLYLFDGFERNIKIMNKFLKRLFRLILGLFLYALGIVITMKAHIGYTPWDVLHVGIAQTIGMSIGNVTIIAGIAIGAIAMMFGEKLGLGTVLNMILIGVFLNFLLGLSFLPLITNFTLSVLMINIGLFVIALASYFYIGSGLGAGPRDSLMVALNRKTGIPIGYCRGAIELAAVLIGWKLGGMVGLGTVISAIAIGFYIQITFKILKFEATKINHQTLNQTLKEFFLLN
jgi:uncharacterized membrane protein YczE